MLSEPTLVTLSGCPVTFVADGEFALPTAVGVEDRGAMATDGGTLGAVISFLPTVVDKDLIRLTEANDHDFYLHGHLEGNPTQDHGSTSWSRLPKRYARLGPAMTSGSFWHGQ